MNPSSNEISQESEPSKFWQKNRKRVMEFLILKVGANLLWTIEKLIPKYSLIGSNPFFEREQFDWVPELEAQWEAIREEMYEVLKYRDELPCFHEILPYQNAQISADNDWRTYFLFGYGNKIEKNCERCPETIAALEKVPGLKTAFFSIFLPGKHLPDHRGPYKGLTRCLLGLKVPEPKELCRIRVDNEVRHWEEGKCMLFDDSFRHEAWNETNETRVVLFIDFVRPLRFPLNIINQLLIQAIAISPLIKDAKVNQKYWDKRLEEVFTQKAKEEEQDQQVLSSK
ncbi:aspartyl/asparaginyl beta-hydroxylase domain-containing protein [Limnoraphis robusta Tam1]|uniref:Aspartyl/asparaginyl beta-hydroxylase domain-containing protein n=1 Tax=Limnoraphis robusta CCNP1315 TaxID=3110306 RepID=A0ABU5U5W1_9CYAN|nr:aspartyl/asparaginyl beta-hydroxylase domain-containing protein [Limnoraphis robusta]MEA5496731.1 aspartyl/asparaginyl beta-hydroxylase domain-containing protein [Limnoraphis robusta BA-68 BA1]MEA5522445.1 aspartyl/asparaginyl beta-hydroxylase domain-containing protein [Limnoraphis robusta CCNP1315]MEA5541588.1 aspartyl/asparaginyl beta-hydroxylase domain-containing protein [Limnoraphis robusta Tam1]MEA5546204.1 aspartyl/asparaginyl beta-hydroxylase domain-containing protein [Limnoraphis rob